MTYIVYRCRMTGLSSQRIRRYDLTCDSERGDLSLRDTMSVKVADRQSLLDRGHHFES
jgi:hypothetical protein